LNCRHQPFQGCALPTELPRHGHGKASDALLQDRQKKSRYLVSSSQRELSKRTVAEREGFEPSVEVLPLRRFSKPLPSATRPPLHSSSSKQLGFAIISYWYFVSVLVPFHRPAEEYARRWASASTDRAQPRPTADDSALNHVSASHRISYSDSRLPLLLQCADDPARWCSIRYHEAPLFSQRPLRRVPARFVWRRPNTAHSRSSHCGFDHGLCTRGHAESWPNISVHKRCEGYRRPRAKRDCRHLVHEPPRGCHD
jgi:hypothetical protein